MTRPTAILGSGVDVQVLIKPIASRRMTPAKPNGEDDLPPPIVRAVPLFSLASLLVVAMNAPCPTIVQVAVLLRFVLISARRSFIVPTPVVSTYIFACNVANLAMAQLTFLTLFNASVLLECPDDRYCPVATSVPKECEGLQSCNSEGARRFTVIPAFMLILVILILSVVYLFVGRCVVIRRARERKEALMADNDEQIDDGEEEENDNAKPEAAEEEGDGIEAGEPPAKPAEIRRSTLTSPELTIDIECERLRLSIPRVGTIMRGVSAKLDHGNLTAIMGPSGAGRFVDADADCRRYTGELIFILHLLGKTTFLSLMSGKQDRTGGKLLINGKEADLTAFRKVIGYVPQEDVVSENIVILEPSLV